MRRAQGPHREPTGRGLPPTARRSADPTLGYGWSDAPGGWAIDIASQAGHLLALLDALAIEQVTVVGHDLGGGIAQILATTSGERIQAMGVVNGVCFDAWPVPAVRVAKASWPALRITPPPVLAASLKPALRMLFAHADRAQRFVPWFAAPWSAPDGPVRLTQHLRALDSVYTQSITPFLSRLSIPVEVVWGRQDHQMKPRFGQRLADTIPGAALALVDDASHFVPGDAPEAVIAGVRRLLSRLPAA